MNLVILFPEIHTFIPSLLDSIWESVAAATKIKLKYLPQVGYGSRSPWELSDCSGDSGTPKWVALSSCAHRVISDIALPHVVSYSLHTQECCLKLGWVMGEPQRKRRKLHNTQPWSNVSQTLKRNLLPWPPTVPRHLVCLRGLEVPS